MKSSTQFTTPSAWMKSSSAWGWIKHKKEPGQKVQAFESKLEKIDDAVVDWHLPSLFKLQR
jgi:hypothetical protein